MFKADESTEVIIVDSFLKVLFSPRLFRFNNTLHLHAEAMCMAVHTLESSLALVIFLIVPECDL